MVCRRIPVRCAGAGLTDTRAAKQHETDESWQVATGRFRALAWIATAGPPRSLTGLELTLACIVPPRRPPRLEREKLELRQKREYAEEAAAIALAEASWVDAIAEACGGRLPIATAQLAIDACDEARRAHEELREPWAAPQLPAACFNDRKVAAFGGGLGDILSKKLSKLELEQAAAREQEEQERRAPTKPARLSSGFGCTALEANLTKQYSRVEMEKQELANAQEEQDRRAPAPKARLSAGFGGASLDEAFGGKRLSKLEREQQQAREVAEARVGPASRRARATADDFGGGLGEICKPKLSRLEQEKLAWQKRAERK